jgi:pimeloyl-ACP methyl ester carboxylesterase
LAGFLEQAGAQDAVVIGWSLGGHVAFEAMLHLTGAAGFVVFGTPPIGTGADFGKAFLPNPALDIGFTPDVRVLLDRMSLKQIVVGDVPGFVINRCLMMFVNEAAALLDDEVATPEQVDALFKGCLGHRTGPLATADLIGLDTVVRTLQVLSGHFGPERFTPCARLLRMCADGRLGRKSGRGFFEYSEGT